jgi:cell division protein FtsN
MRTQVSDKKEDFGKTILAVLLFFLVFGAAAYMFVFVTEKVSAPAGKKAVGKPAENPEVMTNPSDGKEYVYVLADNGSVSVRETETGEPRETVSKAVSKPEPALEKEPEPVKKPEKKAEPESTPKPAQKAEPKPASKPEPKPSSAPKAKQAPKPEPVSKPVTAKNTAPAKNEAANPKNVYVLQLVAYKEKELADAELAKLKSIFPDVFMVKIDLGAKGVWYRIRCCRSATYAEAQKKVSNIKAKYIYSPIIVKSEM